MIGNDPVTFIVNGVEMTREQYVAEHVARWGVPPQDIGTGGTLEIADAEPSP